MRGPTEQPTLWPWPDTLDAVVATPGSHRVVFENQLARVLDVTIAPRRAGARAHPPLAERHGGAPAGADPLLDRRHPDVHLTEQPPPTVQGPRVSWLDPEGPHWVENIDSHPYQAFRIELKQP
jgi:hypothetical protein